MTPERAATLTAYAPNPSPTALPPLLATAVWHGHNLAAEAVCTIGERSMRQRGKKPAAAYQPIVLPGLPFLGAYYARQGWASLPGPWPVKVAIALVLLGLLAVAQIVPGQVDDYLILALPGLFRRVKARHARKAEAR